jgi:tetratricopeptide (TPR) repeat protein
MPYVVNGIGTWYYGKRRVHRVKSTCQCCNRLGELQSYDTTLFFVVFFVPLVPLSQKRVLEECPSCRKHRVLPLKKWEEIEAKDVAQLLDTLRQNPDDRDAILLALGLALSYQDEELFTKLAAGLAEHRLDDAAIQAQLAAGYAYFARHDEAAARYKAALAIEDDPRVRKRLAVELLKLGRPEEARPHLQSVLDEGRRDDAGMIYLLVEGYQAEGMHQEALDVMDRRDAKFPELANDKDCKKQRKTSQRHLSSGKKIRSAILSESGKAGYREGSNWAARLPWVIGPLVAAGLLCWYLAAAYWEGQARKVYLVNGWDKQYKVAVNGREVALDPGQATPVELPEGDVAVESRDPQVPLPPVRCRIETPFWTRPFTRRTFVINPDELALLVWQEAIYSEPPRPSPEPEYHTGQAVYRFEGADYEFKAFPQTIHAEKRSAVHKKRVGVEFLRNMEQRVNVAGRLLTPEQRVAYAKRLVELDPNNPFPLYWLLALLGQEQAIEYLKPGMAVRPLRIEWHRTYQGLMERSHPEVDLRPQYRQLVEETHEHPDALYLLARVSDVDEAEKLLRRAAAGPPSAHVLHSLAYHALASGRFADAVRDAQKAVELAPDNLVMRQNFRQALLAAGEYDRLLKELETRPVGQLPGLDFAARLAEVRVWVAKGDKARARQVIDRALQPLQGPANEQMRKSLERELELALACAAGDVAGFLKLQAEAPDHDPFEAALLADRRKEATGLLEGQKGEQAVLERGLLYLAALKAGDPKLAEQQLPLLLADLGKGGRDERRLAEMLAGKQPVNGDILRRLPMQPEHKRILLAVVARAHPEHAQDLLDLARKMDFQRDATSLCLRKVLE